ncbi:hypothetical protein [Clostridium tagluense]|uniref:hypothetical protein n=1 Tax=Clostridium tagluense TaxID=360422 RepID=UPI001CF1C448|nr:hypothetical protein [Clostridium tagluense]MCB2299347.1 hypothetical protein [Clostridium tagluense]
MTVNVPKHENELAVSFDYSQERIAKVKSIKGHKWNSNDKTWNIPIGVTIYMKSPKSSG